MTFQAPTPVAALHHLAPLPLLRLPCHYPVAPRPPQTLAPHPPFLILLISRLHIIGLRPSFFTLPSYFLISMVRACTKKGLNIRAVWVELRRVDQYVVSHGLPSVFRPDAADYLRGAEKIEASKNRAALPQGYEAVMLLPKAHPSPETTHSN